MSKMPDPFPSLLARIRAIEAKLASKGSPFFGTGVRPNGNQGLDSDNYVPATSGFSLNGGTGVAEFKDIVLYDLPNSMLATPVVPGVHKVNASGFAVTLSWAEVVGGNVTVPEGCTRLLATSSVWVYAINPNTTGGSNGTGGDTLWCYIDVGGSTGEVYGLGLSGSNGYTTATSGFSVLKTGLTPGATLRIKGLASSAYASLGSDAFNSATISTTLIWLR